MQRVYKTLLSAETQVENLLRGKLLTPFPFTLTGVSVIGESQICWCA